MSINVHRGDGDISKNEPVISSLSCGNIAVMIQAGRNSIDNGSNLSPVSQDSVFNSEATTGDTIGVYDALSGYYWRGIVTGVTHGMSGGTLTTRQKILKVVNERV